jgi:hypothetical protein
MQGVTILLIRQKFAGSYGLSIYLQNGLYGSQLNPCMVRMGLDHDNKRKVQK